MKLINTPINAPLTARFFNQPWPFKTRSNHRFAPHFDGLSTYIQFDSPILIKAGEVLSFTIRGLTESNPTRGILYGSVGDSTGLNVFIHDNGNIYCRDADNAISGSVSIDGGEFGLYPVFPVDGGEHVVQVRPSKDLYWDQIIRGDHTSSGRNIAIYNIEANGETWPLDEPFDEYPTLTSSLGNAATAYNFTVDDVKEIKG